MAIAPVGKPVSGEFREKEFKNYFEFIDRVDEWGTRIGATHTIYLTHGNERYARVLKTVAYVCIDENDFGEPVWEKWQIKTLWNHN